MSHDETIDKLKKRGIDYLLSQRVETIKSNEFSVRELKEILEINSSSVHEHMARLVQSREWGTRIAYDPEIRRNIRVWWISE